MLQSNLSPHPYADLHALLAGIRQLKALAHTRTLTDEQIKIVSTVFASFRALLKKDHELHLDDYDLIFAVAQTHKLYSLLPVAEITDAVTYHVFFHAVTAIVKAKYLAHQFDIMGEGVAGRLHFSYSGSTAEWMIPHMKSLFQRYIHSKRLEDFEGHGQVALSPHFSEWVNEQLQHVKPIYDFKEVRLDWKKPLLLPVVVKTKEGTHVFMMAFFEQMLLVFDRTAERYSGASVYVIPSNQLHRRGELIQYIVSTQKVDGVNYVTFEALLGYCKKTLCLNDKPDSHIYLTGQIAENCAWSSCATQAVFCLLLLHAFRAHPQDASQEAKLEHAGHFAVTVFKDWLKFSSQSSLDDYVKFYNEHTNYQQYADRRLLAKIYLQQRCTKPYHMAVRETIARSGFLTEASLHEAQAMLLLDVQHALAHVIACNSEQNIAEIKEIIPRNLSEAVADLSMLQKRSELQQSLFPLVSDLKDTRRHPALTNRVQEICHAAKLSRSTLTEDTWLPSQGINNVIAGLNRKRC